MAGLPSFPRRVRTSAGLSLRREAQWALVLFARGRRQLARHLRGLDVVRASPVRPGAKTPPRRLEAAAVTERPRSVWIRHRTDRPIDRETLTTLVRRLGRSARLAPVYRVPGTTGPGGLVALFPHVLLVETKPDASAADLKQLDHRLATAGLRCDERRTRYLTGFRRYRVVLPGRTAFELARTAKRVAGRLAKSVRFERMPLVPPQALVPDDPFWGNQWGLERIAAPAAWDVTLGHPSVIAAVVDAGCDLSHPDLDFTDDGITIDDDDVAGDGSVTIPGNAHGTACAGIIAARTNNGEGVAGIAGRCRVLSAAVANFTDAEVAAAIRYAVDHGAGLISISLSAYAPGEGLEPTGWDFDVIDPAIEYAFDRGVTICAGTGNDDQGVVNGYPARHPLVIACGGSSTDDNRKSPDSADDECWGANFAEGMSVVAPCVQIPTTDLRGQAGANREGGEVKLPCVTYGRAGDDAGDYFLYFNGTSAATPHVAGVAALVLSTNAFLDSRGVRFVIETTADKVGVRPYAESSAHPVGRWNQRMGYGRINARRAVDVAGGLFALQMNQLFGPG